MYNQWCHSLIFFNYHNWLQKCVQWDGTSLSGHVYHMVTRGRSFIYFCMLCALEISWNWQPKGTITKKLHFSNYSEFDTCNASTQVYSSGALYVVLCFVKECTDEFVSGKFMHKLTHWPRLIPIEYAKTKRKHRITTTLPVKTLTHWLYNIHIQTSSVLIRPTIIHTATHTWPWVLDLPIHHPRSRVNIGIRHIGLGSITILFGAGE